MKDGAPGTAWFTIQIEARNIAHAEYLHTLRNHGLMPSVGRPGRPGDNGYCERFFRTLKQEEIGSKQYRDLEDLRLNIGDFIDRYYNQQRLHSALGYLSPAEFERITVSSEAASMASIVQAKT